MRTSTLHRPSGYFLLEDGTRFDGDLLIGDSPSVGEAVFNTSHTGYQEILSDPSYYRQIVTFTAPHIGNVGVNKLDLESSSIRAAGAVVRSLTESPSNWRSTSPLGAWIQKSGVPLLSGVDTRAVTAHLRSRGAMRSGIFLSGTSETDALGKLLEVPEMSGLNLAAAVSRSEKTVFKHSPHAFSVPGPESGAGLNIGVLDFGVKDNILREPANRGCKVTILPWDEPSELILESKFDGILLSNGPGDPSAVGAGIETTKAMIGRIPMFGICLGHQVICLAAGMNTFKLHFGHRGSNHPVKNYETDTVEITSQNHGFAVSPDTLTAGWKVTHKNLNDGTVEGIAHEEKPVFSIQYHPEASPGPHEGQFYFDKFIQMIKRF